MKYSIVKEKINNIISILISKDYAIGYRFNNDNNEFNIHKEIPFKVLMPGKCEWYADPFPIIHNGKHYIFVEIMKKENKRKGVLGVTCIEDGEGFFHEILSEPFHLSYPNVFKYNDKFFMIPETNQANQIRLYECVNFPNKWELKAILMEDICCADTSLYFSQEGIFCETLDQITGDNRLLFLDMAKYQMREIDSSQSNFVNRRPGGNFINYKNGTYHALQNCEKAYGKYLHIAKVDSFNENGLTEHEIRTLKVEDTTHNAYRKSGLIKRIHTFNRCDDFEVIDYYIYRFNFRK